MMQSKINVIFLKLMHDAIILNVKTSFQFPAATALKLAVACWSLMMTHKVFDIV